MESRWWYYSVKATLLYTMHRIKKDSAWAWIICFGLPQIWLSLLD